MNKRELLLERAINGNGIVSFQDFVNVVSETRPLPLTCSLALICICTHNTIITNYRVQLPHNGRQQPVSS